MKYNEHDSVEYVLVLPRNQSLEVIERISEEDKSEIIIWTISEITKHILKHDVSNISELLKKKRTHKNSKLRECLYNEVKLDPIKTMNCLLNSDPCQKLEYYIPLIHTCRLEKFTNSDVKTRILDQDITFDKYSSPEDAKKFVFEQIITNLREMGLINIEKETGDIYKNSYSLAIDRRWTETKVSKYIKNKYMETYLKNKEGEIQSESVERTKKYQSQKDLISYNT